MRTEDIFMIGFNELTSGNPKSYFIGKHGVVAIIEHPAYGEGDRWFYDVQFDDGTTERIFYPVTIKFKTDQRKY